MENLVTRIRLSKDSAGKLEEMLRKLRGNHEYVKISPSDCASWIVSWFAQSSFDKMQGTLAKAHFDSKAYLQDTIKKMDAGEADQDLIRMSLSKIAGRKVGE